jgi:hypothetical protein
MDTERYAKIPAKNYRKLPDHPNLGQLKRQAKELLAEYRAGNEKAVKRVRRFIEDGQIVRGLRLKDAQEVVAREFTVGPYKVSSWKMLAEYIRAMSGLTPKSLRGWLEASVCEDWEQRGIALRVIVSAPPKKELIAVYFEELAHPDARIREQCLGKLDHSDIPVDARFMAALRKAADDPVANVRRAAIHAMFCQRCKTAGPEVDLDFLARVGLHDENAQTRKTALYGLGQNPNRALAVEAVRRLGEATSEPEIVRRAKVYMDELRNNIRG